MEYNHIKSVIFAITGGITTTCDATNDDKIGINATHGFKYYT